MARKALFSIEEADNGRPAFVQPTPASATSTQEVDASAKRAPRRQEYREGKRAVMFFLNDEAFTEMHVLLARQGRKKVQLLMEELVDDWMRREGAPRLVK